MSDERQETVADVVAEMRQDIADGTVGIWSDFGGEIARGYADRIEAAMRHQFREVAKLIPHEEVTVSKMETTTPTGNAAAMREALEAAIPIMRACLFDYYNTTDVNKVVGKMKAALSAPPRNCDRPECDTTKAAQETWRKEDGGKTAYYEWLFAEAKGYEKISEKAGGIE